MKVTFRGVRGSIPAPGPHTVKYGGNTTCIEIRTADDQLIILDAGTGIFPLAHTLLSRLPVSCHIFITHTHWDHIQGLPFFIPIFIPGNTVKVYGAFDPVDQRNLRDILSRQMEYCYFPVREVELKAKMEYHTIREREVIRIGETTVSGILMNHPVLNFGYKIESGGKTLFFTGDHEILYNIYDPEDSYYQEYEHLIAQKNQMISEFFHGADLLIADSAYTEKEYHSAKRGWGHGTYDSCIKLARAGEVKRLIFTHHEPTRSDTALEQLFNDTMERNPRTATDPEYGLAREGWEIEL